MVWHVGGNSKWAGAYEGKETCWSTSPRQAQATETAVEIHDILGNDEHVVVLGSAKATAQDGSSASMVRIHEQGRVVQYPRAIPFLLMLVAAAGTLYFNATHVPTPVRLIALAVPVASILVTLGLAYLLKMLAAASGAAAIHLAPPALEPNRIVRANDVLQGELVRDPQAPAAPELFPPHPVYGQVPSWAPSQHGQNEPPAVAGDDQMAEATKRRQVEAYLAALAPDQLRHLTTLGPRAAARELTGTLNGQGMAVSERYVQQIFDDWTAASRQPANGRRRR